MSGKGSKPRPYSVTDAEYAANWERTFGASPNGKAAGSNPVDAGSSPAAPAIIPADEADDFLREIYQRAVDRVCEAASREFVSEFFAQNAIYVDAETGAQVTEDWWPGDPV